MLVRKFIVGLTGGIASGKSTAASIFSSLGVRVIDADLIARVLIERGQFDQLLRDHLGSVIFNEQGQLSRSILRKITFSNEKNRKWLEQLLHPFIYKKINETIAQFSAPYFLVDLPLLFESETNFQVNRILLLDAPEHTQIQRAQQRDNNKISLEQIKAIMNAQWPRENKIRRADDVIVNDLNFYNLFKQVHYLHEQYTQWISKVG